MISVFRKILDFFMVLCIAWGSLFTFGSYDDDLAVIEKNIVNGLISGTVSPFSSSDINDADTLISLIAYDKNGNCYFTDVDYSDTSRTDWKTKRHLNRTERLAIIYRNETDEAKKSELKKYILKLLDHWVANDYQNSNWWFNKLATPNTLGETALLMKKDLSCTQLTALEELIGRGSFSVNYSVREHAGANIIDMAMSTIKFGVLSDSRTSVKTAVRLVEKELEYSDDEGLRADGTFFQHGCRLYMGGYGITFVGGMASLIGMLAGTKYNFSQEHLGHLANFITDGLAVMSFGNILDPTVIGRSVSRFNNQPLGGLANTLRKLAAVEEMPRKEEILAYAQSIENNTKQDTGVHYFDEAEFLVINNSDFYFSFRGGAEELAYSEIINDENILSYNSSFPGVTTIMHTGREYTNISPLLDYSKIPGTTAVFETDEQLLAHADHTYRYLDGIYGSVKADGAAVSSAQTVHEDISMTVACFATDNAAFLLGAGFSDAKGRTLTATIDQSFSAGEIQRNGNTVIHNGIKYTLLDGGTLNAVCEHKTGNWRRNNTSLSTEPVEGDLFTVSFENTGSYAYSVMSENTDESIEIIRNDTTVQAVRLPDGRIAAAFYANTSFEYGGKTYNGKAGETFIR